MKINQNINDHLYIDKVDMQKKACVEAELLKFTTSENTNQTTVNLGHESGTLTQEAEASATKDNGWVADDRNANETAEKGAVTTGANKLGRRARKRLNQKKWGPINEARKKAEMEKAANDMIGKNVNEVLDQTASGMEKLGKAELSLDAIEAGVSCLYARIFLKL